MSSLHIASCSAGLMAYYYFILRKYNTLGFRLFSVLTIISLGICYWWHLNKQQLKHRQHTGMTTQALVLRKSVQGTNYSVQVRFVDQAGEQQIRTQNSGISEGEFTDIQEGDRVSVLYNRSTDTLYLTSSHERQLTLNDYILLLPCVLLTLGVICWINLNKYRIHPHEGSLFEYLIDEQGQVIYDTKDRIKQVSYRIGLTTRINQLFQRH